ncbi:LysM peptidoglycan-binding domain-containing protein [Sinanaerobacter sp. ZZT-01]|uniref:LysM peptidoglycan-binding domain-containing protein n=1 Tax=Sinanaerobacter sp. ZZT-01 TaxID=3111540 RepID=UPI002D779B1A|nr:LysM peptidoglycan-binding domain-containing protein [Sinanaerobacter sp. ZZT-01]WRR94088.1 LysM peptidoglycan-binding domain-containing protein [Sinanaerobacter sp. ZZT-01]
MYEFILDDMQLPVAPQKMKMKMSNQNKTINLISGQEVNIPKIAGLTEIEFSSLLPAQPYPFAVYPTGFQSPEFYLKKLELLKQGRKPFIFLVNRKQLNGTYSYNISKNVTLEEYTIEEDAANGFDIMVSIRLKQYVTYGTILVNVSENKETGDVTLEKQVQREAKVTNKTYAVQPNDTLWSICKKELGDEKVYSKILVLNGLTNPNEIYPGQVIRFE